MIRRRSWKLTHVNGTKNRACTMKYVGPRHMMVNATTNCYMPVKKQDIQRDDTIHDTCTKTTNVNTDLWQETQCKPFNISEISDLFRMYNHDGYNHVYCYPQKILWNDQEKDCPTYPFRIPEEESFKVGSHIYNSERRTIQTGQWDVEIAASKINYKIGSEGLPLVYNNISNLDKVNTTKLDIIKLVKEIPSDIYVDKLSNFVDGLTKLEPLNLGFFTYIKYGALIIATLFVVSFTSPFILVFIWILRRASKPVYTCVNLYKDFGYGTGNVVLPTHVPSKKEYRLLL